MLAQGTDLYVVSEVLGHAGIAITKDIYGHLVEGHKRGAAVSMTSALPMRSWAGVVSPEPATGTTHDG